MIDLFQVHDFVTYLNGEYPELRLFVKYDLTFFTLHVQIAPKKWHENVEYYSGQFTVYETKECISRINDAFIVYLAYLSHMKIKLSEKEVSEDAGTN